MDRPEIAPGSGRDSGVGGSTDEIDEGVVVDSPIKRRLEWLTRRIASGGDLSVNELERHFAPSFVERSPLDAMRQHLKELSTKGGLRLDVPVYHSQRYWRGYGRCGDERVFVGAQLERSEPHRFLALIVQPAPNRIRVLLSTPGEHGVIEDIVQKYVAPLADRLDAGGVVVGLVRGTDECVSTFGAVRPTDVFEIGSLTKSFTGTLLADVVHRDELSLADPVQRFVPADVALPKDATGREIALVDLATHRSGLPHLPPDLAPGEPNNPYADYDVAELYESLRRTTLQGRVGATFRYSNYGYALLGHVLSRALDASYSDLIAERICDVLGLSETVVDIDPALLTRTAQGHGFSGNRMPLMDRPVFAASGGIKSTMRDLLRYVRAQLDPVSCPLTNAIAMTHIPRAAIGMITHYGLGWRVTILPEHGPLVWHEGRSGGFSTQVALCPRAMTGIALVTNSTSNHIDEPFKVLGALLNDAPMDVEHSRPVQ